MKKVLIIDDDPDIREILRTVLESKYEVGEAKSRAEGMSALKTFKPDLTILDVMMEHFDSGFEMAREIGQDEELRDTKILMLTSADKALELDFEKFAGDPEWLPIDDYLIKPIEPTHVLASVEKLLGTK